MVPFVRCDEDFKMISQDTRKISQKIVMAFFATFLID